MQEFLGTYLGVHVIFKYLVWIHTQTQALMGKLGDACLFYFLGQTTSRPTTKKEKSTDVKCVLLKKNRFVNGVDLST